MLVGRQKLHFKTQILHKIQDHYRTNIYLGLEKWNTNKRVHPQIKNKQFVENISKIQY